MHITLSHIRLLPCLQSGRVPRSDEILFLTRHCEALRSNLFFNNVANSYAYYFKPHQTASLSAIRQGASQ
jgi:hypothetical protein